MSNAVIDPFAVGMSSLSSLREPVLSVGVSARLSLMPTTVCGDFRACISVSVDSFGLRFEICA